MLLDLRLPSHTHRTHTYHKHHKQHPQTARPTLTHTHHSPLAITLPTHIPTHTNTHRVACAHRLPSITAIKPHTHFATTCLSPLPHLPAAPHPLASHTQGTTTTLAPPATATPTLPHPCLHITAALSPPTYPHVLPTLPCHTAQHTHILGCTITPTYYTHSSVCVSLPLLPSQADPTAHINHHTPHPHIHHLLTPTPTSAGPSVRPDVGPERSLRRHRCCWTSDCPRTHIAHTHITHIANNTHKQQHPR